VRIGSFSAAMVYQPVCDVGGVAALDPSARCPQACAPGDAGKGRLFIGVRGDSSLTWADLEASDQGTNPVIGCSATEPPGSFPACDSLHRVTSTDDGIGSATLAPQAQPIAVPDEPYALALDAVRQLLYVGHLRGDIAHADTGGISLFDVVDPKTTPPSLIGVHGSIFPSDGNGLFGVTSLTRQDFGGNQGEMFATSRYLPRVGGVVPANIPINDCTSAISHAEIALVPTGDAFDTTLPGTETRGIQFLPDAPRIFVLQRVPPALIAFDVSTDSLGGTIVAPTDVIETCAQPTFLQMHNPAGTGRRLFITCFETGQVYVIDPYVPRQTNVIEVGRGPAGLAFGPGPGQDPATTPADEGTRAYVVGFGDNNISVVDLAPSTDPDPNRSTQYHVIQRIGFPSTVPR
jgi:hypothetical protein